MPRAPLPSRKGIPQSYKTAVAAKLNWLKRMVKGAQGTAQSHNSFYWIRRHPGYLDELTPERRECLFKIEHRLVIAREALKSVEEAIDEYYKAPKTPMPKRERHNAQRRAKTATKAAEKSTGA